MKISKRIATSPIGDIELYKLENASGAWVELSNLGAGIIGVGVPDRNGKIENIALSYKNPADYLNDGPCMGKCPGRYANRITHGKLSIDGKNYQLALNCGPNHLHGGPNGFQNQLWRVKLLTDGIEFSYLSDNGEENYPGKLSVKAIYKWSEQNSLSIQFIAETDAKTVVNLTNHTYWNLRGADFGSALSHELKIKSSKWLPTDESLSPLGMLADVAETPMDFRNFKQLATDINADFDALKFGKGYDNCWAFDGWHKGLLIKDAVILRDKESGRMITIDTDQPGTQVYTGNWLDGCPHNNSDRCYNDYDGVAIEAQGFPDAPNINNFPSQLLSPGEKYKRIIIYNFKNF